MPYTIGDRVFRTKDDVLDLCRTILRETRDGERVRSEHEPFLFALFQYHDEWDTEGGVEAFSAATTEQGTRCFLLIRADGSAIDISFPYTVRKLPSTRTADLQPQALRDFRNAAREAVAADIRAFRDRALRPDSVCPVTGVVLTRENVSVDHEAPDTFDRLLFNFCVEVRVDPLQVVVDSHKGTVPVFRDARLHDWWVAYHRTHARLRLTSTAGNLQLKKVAVSWGPVCRKEGPGVAR